MLNEITEMLKKEQEFFTKAKKIKDSLYNDSLINISFKIKKEQKIKELKKVDILKKVENLVVKPTISGLQKDGIDYRGFIFIGLMNNNGNPSVVEYNVRMGDPETEVVFPRIESDLFDLFEGDANQTLHEKEFSVTEKIATTVVLVSGGYPEAYKKGAHISGLENVKNSIVFHAGTTLKDTTVITNGGRVIAVTSLADSIQEALNTSYKSIDEIHFEKMNYRKDIGFDLT